MTGLGYYTRCISFRFKLQITFSVLMVINWCKLSGHVKMVWVTYAAVGVVNKALYIIFVQCFV